mmetsp:Transcript_11821/g.32786  ORF Transcript_11821/g.32786 Transcript_11821/m.32786 type:complete len:375 (-) Transcript_11821:108-1232(-)
MTVRSVLLSFLTASFWTTTSTRHFSVAAAFVAPNRQHPNHSIIMTAVRRNSKAKSNNNNNNNNNNSPATTLRGGGATKTAATTSPTQLSMTPNSIIFDNTPLWQNQGITIALNALGFVISVATGSHVHLDLLGTGAFAAGAYFALPAAANFRIASSTAAVVLWAGKLASFLFYRALQVQHDGRLTTTLATTSGAFGFWFVSALWGIVTALPHTLGTTNLQHGGTPLTNGLGLGMFAVGWIVETVADYQKWVFKQSNPSGAFCNVGLWSISQHPNWFGNLVLWLGIFVLNAPALVEPTPEKASWLSVVWSWRRLALAGLSPLFMWTLFSGQAEGRITNALQMANDKYGYGTDPVYTDYIDTTPLIIPRFGLGGGP